ncbi:MAG: glutamine amidotransferase [Dehalococcoidia bacterium]|jgi:CobQ-like glutamine amidotransferase family enzyme
MTTTLRLAHLYPKLMNLYGDRGNIICLRCRCQARGIELAVDELDLGDRLNPKEYDLIFIGGGQDREQRRIVDDLIDVKGESIRKAVEGGVTALAVCGGYQLFARYYRPAVGDDLPGLGIFDAWTEHPGENVPRCIGNVVADWEDGVLVGFENHGGRTYLGPNARPLARVRSGYGNNGVDKTEGAVYKNAYGTYLHGSLLPKNPRFADHLLRLALRRRHGDIDLPPLDDRLEDDAHAAAARIASGERRR